MRLQALSAVGLVAGLTLGAAAVSSAELLPPELAKKPTTTTTAPATTTTAAPTTTTTSTTTTTLPPVPDVTVTMIDTGVRATHQEFNYGGATDASDQFVAWWDFSGEGSGTLPGIGDTWDPTIADPYDGNGHGTATASLAVGSNAAGSASKYPSYAPGVKLAVAKVGEADGTVSGDLAAAIRWARESVESDVISMSIGNIVPLPALLSTDIYREIRLAREAGILVTLSNGNGFANAGVPGEPGFATGYANSPDALGVGADDIDGPFVTTDPEVVAPFFDVPSASISCDSCYAPVSGTSFGTPIVAGLAAHLIQEADASAANRSPEQIETLIKYSAVDTIVPPTFEGYGVIRPSIVAGAETHAAAGTLPSRPDPDVNGLYVETVQGTLDQVWTKALAGNLETMSRTTIGALSTQGQIGPSAPTGLSVAEMYELSASAGDVVSVDMAYVAAPDGVTDIDVYVFSGSGLAFNGARLLDKSNNAADVGESIEFVAPVSGPYTVVVIGWSVTTPASVTLTSSHALSFELQDYMLHTFGTGLFL